MMRSYESVAVLIPCLNEERTVGDVVRGFSATLPGARIYVFDNASDDRTAERAAAAGATVVSSPERGKGNVVRHMFKTVDADQYLMVDGDGTYPAEFAVPLLNALERNGWDMAVGRRISSKDLLSKAYRPMHLAGNQLVCALIHASFGSDIHDVFSGFRAFRRTYVASIPLVSQGFEIEVEMTLQSLSKGYRIGELAVPYGVRPPGSLSKLDTWKDGWLVLKAFASICRDYRPGLFFGIIAMALAASSLAAGIWPVMDYLEYRYVYRFPLAVMATGLAILAAMSFTVGLILQTQLKYHNETHVLLRSLDCWVARRTPPNNEQPPTPVTGTVRVKRMDNRL
jgi:glycosyltransferase involved in cell wall biosynthesis